MCVYLRTKFQVSKIILTSFRQGEGNFIENFVENRLQHRCFPVKFSKFLGTLFFAEHLRWLLLKFIKRIKTRFHENWCSVSQSALARHLRGYSF